MHNIATLALVGGLLAGEASAHLGAGFPGRLPQELQKRAAKRGMQRRQAAYNDQSWQSVTVPKQECTYYNYGPASTFTTAFPTAWQIADIMPNDQQAHSVWGQLQQQVKVPNIAPKGQPTGSMQGTTYNAGQDPDCWWTATKCVHPKQAEIPTDVYTCDEPETWGLTFDDGPNCTHNAFYDFLKSKNQKATLFYIGSNVLDWPLQAQRGLTDGHQLAAHTWSHRYMTALTDTQVFAELFYTVKVIKWITGVTVTSWRPPYGDVDDRVRAIAYGLGLETVIWSDDTNDWEVQPQGTAPSSVIEANYASIISKGSGPAGQTGGVVVLTHEINGDTMTMFQSEYPAIAEAFKYLVPVDTCRNKTQPYRETSYVYPNFDQYTGGNVMPQGIPAATAITAASVASVEVGIISSTAPMATLSPSTGPSTAASSSGSSAAGSTKASSSSSASASSTSEKHGAAMGHLHGAAAGSAALAAMGGAAALFI